MNQYRTLLLLSLCCFAIAGCGFHLRDYAILPPQFQVLYLQPSNPASPLTHQLQQTLRASRIVLVSSPAQAPYTLQILSDSFTQQLTTISSNTQVRTYLLTYTVIYQILDRRGKIIYGPMIASTTSPFSTSDAQLLADSNLLAQQQATMLQTVINQIFVQLGSERAIAALRHPP